MRRITASFFIVGLASIAVLGIGKLPESGAQSEAKNHLPPLTIEANGETRREVLERLLDQAGVRYRIDSPFSDRITFRGRGSLPVLLKMLLRDSEVKETDEGGRTYTVRQQYACDIEKDGTYHIYAKPLWRGIPERPDLRYKAIKIKTTRPMPLCEMLEIVFTQIQMTYKAPPEAARILVGRTEIKSALLPYVLDSVLNHTKPATAFRYRFEKGICIIDIEHTKAEP